jgi:DNA polymerase-4
MDRWIFHVDINAFYASVEINDHPEYEGKAVVVCSDTQRAVITTANYIARSYGITSAMPLSVALKKQPDLIITGLNFDRYRTVSKQFIDICQTYSTKLEQASIDECYLDVTVPIEAYEKPLDMAINLQKEIKQKLNLQVSIGIAPNVFLAKMASNMRKPNGLTIIRENEISTKLWPLPIEEMHGIGKKTVVLLKAKDIHTIGDFAAIEANQISDVFKNHADEMIQRAWGIDDREVEADHQIKSIGNSSSLIKLTDDMTEIQTALRSICSDLSNRLKNRDLSMKQMTLSIKDEQNQSYARSLLLDKAIVEAEDIYEQALMIFDDHFNDWAIKNIGISTNKIMDQSFNIQQLSLFKE